MSHKFTVNGEEYTFLTDDDLTFGEACVVERTSGVRFTDEQGRGSMVFLQAMVWVSMKRKDVNLPFSAVDDVPMKVLADLVDDEDEPDEGEDPKASGDVAADDPTSPGDD